MENFNKFGWMIAVIIAIIAPSFYTSSSFFGGSTDSGYNATANGVYAVDGTTVIDGSGNWIGAITATTLTAAATTLSGLLTTDAGHIKSYTNSTTTTATAQTLKLSDVQNYSTVILTPNTASDTVTLFASSTASAWLPSAGYSQSTCFINGTTTTGINLTFAGGTGTIIQVASSSATALGSLNL